MRNFRWPRALAVTALCCALFATCGDRDGQVIHFYAAASLADAAQELAAVWSEQSETEVRPVLASSSTLARQIREGAPATLFLSASQDWMDYLVRETDRVDSPSRLDLLENTLILVVPPGNPAGVETPEDLAAKGVEHLALGDPEHVPAGIYAARWLKAAELWSAVKGKVRPAQDVRAALTYVERGEVEAGIVYLTDAQAGEVEAVALLDPALIPPIRYPLALILKDGEEEPDPKGTAFHRWLRGKEASAIFARHGFRPMSAASRL